MLTQQLREMEAGERDRLESILQALINWGTSWTRDRDEAAEPAAADSSACPVDEG